MTQPYCFEYGEPAAMAVGLKITQFVTLDDGQEVSYTARFLKGQVGRFSHYSSDGTRAFVTMPDKFGDFYDLDLEIDRLTFPTGVTNRNQLYDWMFQVNWQ